MIDQENDTLSANTNKNTHMMYHQDKKTNLITCTTEMPTNITNTDVSRDNCRKKEKTELSSNQRRRPLPPSPTCTSSHPSSDDLAETMEQLSEFNLYEDDQLGFDFSSSEHDNSNDVSDFNDLPIHIEDESLSTSQAQVPMASILSTKPCTSSAPTKKEDGLYQRKSGGERTVRFSSCLVTGIYTRPRTSEDEWHEYYYSSHELQRMFDDYTGNSNPMRRQQCIIVAEEEDLDLWESTEPSVAS